MNQITIKKNVRWLFLTFYFLMACIFVTIIALSLSEPQHNLFPWQMILGTGMGSLILLVCFKIWTKLYETKLTHIYVCMYVCGGIFLFVLSCLGRNLPASFVDYGIVWDSAIALEKYGESAVNAVYFERYSNNFKPMLFLAFLFRIASTLHIEEPYYFLLLFSVLCVLGAIYAATYLLREKGEKQGVFDIPILLLFLCLFPIWANVQALYTDTLSFPFTIIAFAFIKKAMCSDITWQKILFAVLPGLCVSFAFDMKATAIIPVVAGVICFAFFCRKKKDWFMILVSSVSFLLFQVMGEVVANTFEIWRNAKETSAPIISWIALGLGGNGSFGDNLTYAYTMIAQPTKQAKSDYAMEYIRENKDQFFNISHLISKLRYNYASGGLGMKDYTYMPYDEPNIVYELFSPWGAHYWRTSQISFCYLFSIYTMNLLGCICSFLSIIKKKKLSLLKIICDLSFFGYFVFLMLWEANNRQLYNLVPVLFVGTVLNIKLILDFFNKNN